VGSIIAGGDRGLPDRPGHRLQRSEASSRSAEGCQTYFAVLLDDNNRKPIARLHFNRTQKYIGIFDDNREETRVPISSLEDIYEHTEALRASVKGYL
jgi:hypothetical protein